MWKTDAKLSSIAGSDGGDQRLEYRMLGPVEVVRDGEIVDLGVLKQRALLALLLINANAVVSTDRIIDELWGDGGPQDREKALWVVVSRLRTALEPNRKKRSEGAILLSRPPGYVLSVDPEAIDSNRFESLANEGRALLETDPATASIALSEALSLWRGHALEEFMYEAFADAEVTRLDELRLAALEDRVDADLRTGRARELVSELEGLVRQHPTRERMNGHLMLALHLSGRQSDALHAFGTYRAYLADELGLEPPPEISKLEERIVLDDPELRQIGAVRALAGRPEPGLSVRGYELRGQVGSGAMGTVYRAYQPAVGRDVAIKVIRPELANDPSFIRHFEAEAQLIARLEHPQIVPVFDYWREPDSAYLVTRHFVSGSLRDLADSGDLSWERAARVVIQMTSALSAAHRQGVAHGDLKPENILIDGEGNAYLTDFGMSWSAGNDSEFLAPEQLSGSGPTPAADQFALGRVVEFTLRGASDREHGAEISNVIAKASAERPGDRFADVESFQAALTDSLDAPIDVLEPADIINPYRGLHAFDESDADRFFGRERLIERLISRFGHRGPQGRFVAVVGPSGSGKSSVVRAGMVPALREAAVPGSDNWFITTMIPGRHPFESLEEALRAVAVDPPPDLLERLSTEGIAAAVDGLKPEPGAQVVIVIDQLEELFSLAPAPEADRFMTAVANAVRDRHSSVKVIATLRADFYDHPLRHASFGELVRLGTEVITPMTAQELERAITGPAAQVGVSFETGLVVTIASDLADQSTALPLLQYALTELFERRTGSMITAATYEELGGVSAALARRADGLYGGLNPEDRRIVHEVFLRLVTLNDDGADTRRRAHVSELNDAGRGDSGPILDAFGRHRLLAFDRDPVTRGPTVEMAHEALLTEWSLLRRWIDEARVDIQAERQLAGAVQEWQESGNDPDFLLTGARLARYDGWSEQPPVPLTAVEREYLAHSHHATEAELTIERRRVGRLRRLVVGVGIALVLALVAGGIALQQQQRASDETQRAEEEAQRANEEAERAEAAAADAEAQRVAAVQAAADAELATIISRSAAVRTDDPELGLLLALEAYVREPGPTTELAVLGALSGASIGRRVASHTRLTDDCTGESVLLPGFGAAAEFATIDGELVVRNTLTGEVLGGPSSPAPCTVGAFDEDWGVVQTFDGGTVWLGTELDVVVELEPPARIGWLAGTTALIFEQGTDSRVSQARVFDSLSGEPIGEPVLGNEAGSFVDWSAISSPDDSMYVMGFAARDGDAGQLIVVDATDATELMRVDLPGCCPTITWDPTTDHIVLGFQNGLIRSVDPSTGATTSDVDLDLLRGPLDIGVLSDGTLVVVTAGAISLVDRSSGPIGEPLRLQNVREAVVGTDGLVVTADDEGVIEVIDPVGSALIRQIDVESTDRVGFDQGFAGMTSDFQSAAVVDLETGQRTNIELRDPNGDFFLPGVVYPAPDGVWAVSPDHVLARWEAGTMVESISLGSSDDVSSVLYGFGPKPAGTRWGDMYAVPGRRPDGTTEVTLASMRPGEAQVLMTIETPGAHWAHPTPDGGLYVHSEDATLRVYDADGQLVDEFATGAKDPYAFSLDPTGAKLAFGDLGGLSDDRSADEAQILIMDTATGRVEIVPQDGIASTISFNADGSHVVLAMFDGTVRLWDVDSSGVPTIVWTGSGTFDSEPGWYDEATDSIWTMAGGKLLNIPLDPAGWVDLACEIVGRDLTQEEWDRLVPGDEPLRSACGPR